MERKCHIAKLLARTSPPQSSSNYVSQLLYSNNKAIQCSSKLNYIIICFPFRKKNAWSFQNNVDQSHVNRILLQQDSENAETKCFFFFRRRLMFTFSWKETSFHEDYLTLKLATTVKDSVSGESTGKKNVQNPHKAPRENQQNKNTRKNEKKKTRRERNSFRE